MSTQTNETTRTAKSSADQMHFIGTRVSTRQFKRLLATTTSAAGRNALKRLNGVTSKRLENDLAAKVYAEKNRGRKKGAKKAA